MTPGQMQLTRILSLRSSSAAVPAFLVQVGNHNRCTFAPKRVALARPNPLAAPVTTATFPSSLPIDANSFLYEDGEHHCHSEDGIEGVSGPIHDGGATPTCACRTPLFKQPS